MQVRIAERGHEQLVLAEAANVGVRTDERLDFLGGAHGDDRVAGNGDTAGRGCFIAAHGAEHGVGNNDDICRCD